MANQLVREGLTVIWTQSPTLFAGTELPAGSFLVPCSPPMQPAPFAGAWRRRIAKGLAPYGLDLLEAEAGDVVGTNLLKVRLGVYGEAGSPFPHLAHLTTLGFHTQPLTAEQIRNGELAEFDVLVVPGGGLDGMAGMFRPLGEKGARAIADFVTNGGGYLSSCAGSYLAAALPPEQAEQISSAQSCMRLVGATPVNGLGEGVSGFRTPGIGVVRLANNEPEHPVMFGVPAEFPCTHYNGPFFRLDPDAVAGAPPPQVLARLVGTTSEFTPGEVSFPDHRPAPYLVDNAIDVGAASIVVGHLGKGAAVLAGSHPEFGLDALTMADLGPQARILGNAVWWLGLLGRPGPYFIPAVDGEPTVQLKVGRLLRLVGRLRAEGASAPLSPRARAQFGRSTVQGWQETLDQLELRLRRSGNRWADLGELAAGIAGRLRKERASCAWSEEWLSVWVAIGQRRPGHGQPDYGYRGFLALLDLMEEQMEAALAALGQSGGGGAVPYDLVARSYLSAIGTMVAAEGSLERAITCLDQLQERINWNTDGGEDTVS